MALTAFRAAVDGQSKLGFSQIAVVNRPSHTLSVPHKMISESAACLNCPNGVRGSFAGPLVKSTYVKLTGNAQPVLLKNSTRSRPQGRNADYTLKWISVAKCAQ